MAAQGRGARTGGIYRVRQEQLHTKEKSVTREFENSDRRPFTGKVRNKWRQGLGDDETIIHRKRVRHAGNLQEPCDYEMDQMHRPFDEADAFDKNLKR